jgi:hypothetical protein
MMIFILTVHPVSPILIHTVTLITLRSYYVLASDWVKGLKRKNSHVAHVFRQVPISRHTKFGLNRLRG